jgi:hypothetical protein
MEHSTKELWPQNPTGSPHSIIKYTVYLAHDKTLVIFDENELSKITRESNKCAASWAVTQ